MEVGRVFLATTAEGTVRAVAAGELWSVEPVLEDVDVRCLAAEPTRCSEVFAGTEQRGVFRSRDRGRTWQQAGLQGKRIRSLAVSGAEPGLLYAGTKPPAIFVSKDSGESWDELDAFRHLKSRRLWLSPAEPPSLGGYVQALAASPADPEVLLAGIEVGGVFRTADGGVTWSRGKGAIMDCHTLAFHVTDGRYAYQGGAGLKGAAAVSSDAGLTWTASRDGQEHRYGWAVAADSERPDIVYVSAAPGPRSHAGNANAAIFRREGDGPWTRLSGGLPEPLEHMPYALLTEPDSPGNLFVGLSNGEVWHTLDHGDLWAQLPLDLGSIERSLVTCGPG